MSTTASTLLVRGIHVWYSGSAPVPKYKIQTFKSGAKVGTVSLCAFLVGSKVLVIIDSRLILYSQLLWNRLMLQIAFDITNKQLSAKTNYEYQV